VTTLVPSPSTRRLLEKRLEVYEAQFSDSPASTYWESRGLTRATARAFRVGYVGDPLPGDDRFRGRLAIPYLTPSGVVGMKFRAIDGDDNRWMKDKGEANLIFNTRVLVHARKVVITEGEMDCISAVQAGLQAVGIPGASNWRKEWSRIFYQREVTVLAQGDDPGREFAERVINGIDGGRIVYMPEGEDVNSMLQREGEEWIYMAAVMAG